VSALCSRLRLLFALLAASAVLLVSCEGDDKDPPPSEDTTGARVIFELDERNDSGVKVQVDLTDSGDETTIAIVSFDGVGDGAEITSQVYAVEECDDLSGEAEFALTDAEADVSRTELEVTMSELQEGDYLISVAPIDDESSQLACGAIPNARS
jgi:hypothetical protein